MKLSTVMKCVQNMTTNWTLGSHSGHRATLRRLSWTTSYALLRTDFLMADSNEELARISAIHGVKAWS